MTPGCHGHCRNVGRANRTAQRLIIMQHPHQVESPRDSELAECNGVRESAREGTVSDGLFVLSAQTGGSDTGIGTHKQGSGKSLC